jgi:hypothetical protein
MRLVLVCRRHLSFYPNKRKHTSRMDAMRCDAINGMAPGVGFSSMHDNGTAIQICLLVEIPEASESPVEFVAHLAIAARGELAGAGRAKGGTPAGIALVGDLLLVALEAIVVGAGQSAAAGRRCDRRCRLRVLGKVESDHGGGLVWSVFGSDDGWNGASGRRRLEAKRMYLVGRLCCRCGTRILWQTKRFVCSLCFLYVLTS